MNLGRDHLDQQVVAIRLSGGLGNQLFQYAAARATADRLKCGLLIDTSTLEQHRKGVTPRNFALDQFAFKGRICTLSPRRRLVSKVLGSRHHQLSHRAQKWFREFREDSFAYDRRFLTVQEGTVLQGYFQSPEYFQHIADEIAVDFHKLINPTSWFMDTKAHVRSQGQSVAVHIRRGDFLSTSNMRFHGILPNVYYSNALAEVASRSTVESIFVFSDDHQGKVLDGISWPVQPRFVRPPSNSKPMESLILMSQAQTIITANSSFSWWGAWLGWYLRRATVIVPDPWLRSLGEGFTGLFPNGWSRLGHTWEGSV